jgi:hypothetical protein
MGREPMFKTIRQLFSKSNTNPGLPLGGYQEHLAASGHVEQLSDRDLQRLNDLLPWQCFTADLQGRRFGNMAWKGKRDLPQEIPDKRIKKLHEIFDLSNKDVLEIGCFEGIHTIGLCNYSRRVYAVDSRIENVIKTIVRTNMFGHHPTVTVFDADSDATPPHEGHYQIIHHVGVLYHLAEPVRHLLSLRSDSLEGILLDTHYATAEMATKEYTASNGNPYRYHHFKEGGRDEVFSGMHDHAKWLTKDDLFELLKQIGLTDIQVAADTMQRNGPRLTVFAQRS